MINPNYLGFIYGLSAYLIWGIFPLYFHWLRHVEPIQILMHRVIWSFVFVSLLLIMLHKSKVLCKAVRSASILRSMLLSSVLIAANWLIFIWSVGQGRVLETSLGYFLTPLLSVVLAHLILKEKLDKYRLAACGLAVIGVVWVMVSLGSLPWISLTLAISFALYGLVRKRADIDSLSGLTLETALLLPFALLYWLWLSWQGESQFLQQGGSTTLLLLFSGIATAMTLLLFAAGAKKLSLTTIGFMMYINPTMQFLTAVFILHEPFSNEKLIGFLWIWAALTVFTWGAVRQRGHHG